jgi:hypothetical protein
MKGPSTLVLALLSGAIMIVGCGRKPAPPPPQSPSANIGTDPRAVAASNPGDPDILNKAVAAKPQTLMQIDKATTQEAKTQMLTDALTTWEDWNGKSPTNLEQLVEKKIIDRIPEPPPGRKYVIDAKKHVVVLQ